MIQITLKDNIVKEYEENTAISEITKEISMGLYRVATCARLNGKIVDLRTKVTENSTLEILTFEDADGKKTFWHTASHVLAQAVKTLFPDAKFAIGPAIDNGFYYDFDVAKPFSSEDLVSIEAEMKKIIKTNDFLEQTLVSAEQANEIMKDEPYKLELIAEHSANGEALSFFKQGDFTDLCAGPHLMSTGTIKAFRLTSATAAYWRGDSKNATLCRIYGTAYPKAAELEEHLAAIEDAKKRDHNKIGRDLKYFTTSEAIGQGLPLLMPKGAKLFQTLNRYVQDKEEFEYGYVMTRTPLMAKSDLYKLSGHWDHYKDGMFVLGDEAVDKEVFALRPMTCPFQYQVYLAEKHSYRDLPIRYAETSTLFRNESSGEMHGLIRVRQFTISEGHLILRPDQLAEEFMKCIKLSTEIMTDVGLIGDLTYRLSKWDPTDSEKYIGSPEMWNEAEGLMRNILDDMNMDYTEAVGEAAFYGPKLDIQIKNVHGKEDTLITVQIDLALAKQFSMTYTDADGSEKNPYIIHRTSLGCYERTIAILLEKYAGALPTWLIPTQVMVVPISESHHEYARTVNETLLKAGIRSVADYRNEKMGYKIREAQLDKIPYMLVVGDKEEEDGTVAVRARKEGNGGTKSISDFISDIKEEIANHVC